jgi:xanthine/uracil permease
MVNRPANLIYGVDERPPFLPTCLLSIQHLFVFFISVVLAVFLLHEMGADKVDPVSANGFISMCMIAGGITTWAPASSARRSAVHPTSPHPSWQVAQEDSHWSSA